MNEIIEKLEQSLEDDKHAELTHTCADEGDTIRCVDCAKDVSCWNNSGFFNYCNDCLDVECSLEMNQTDEDDAEYYCDDEED